ncbi:MAG: hypothetical protein V4591_06945, partial [Bdellovibrionota bacterium]
MNKNPKETVHENGTTSYDHTFDPNELKIIEDDCKKLTAKLPKPLGEITFAATNEKPTILRALKTDVSEPGTSLLQEFKDKEAALVKAFTPPKENAKVSITSIPSFVFLPSSQVEYEEQNVCFVDLLSKLCEKAYSPGSKKYDPVEFTLFVKNFFKEEIDAGYISQYAIRHLVRGTLADSIAMISFYVYLRFNLASNIKSRKNDNTLSTSPPLFRDILLALSIIAEENPIFETEENSAFFVSKLAQKFNEIVFRDIKEKSVVEKDISTVVAHSAEISYETMTPESKQNYLEKLLKSPEPKDWLKHGVLSLYTPYQESLETLKKTVVQLSGEELWESLKSHFEIESPEYLSTMEELNKYKANLTDKIQLLSTWLSFCLDLGFVELTPVEKTTTSSTRPSKQQKFTISNWLMQDNIKEKHTQTNEIRDQISHLLTAHLKQQDTKEKDLENSDPYKAFIIEFLSPVSNYESPKDLKKLTKIKEFLSLRAVLNDGGSLRNSHGDIVVNNIKIPVTSQQRQVSLLLSELKGHVKNIKEKITAGSLKLYASYTERLDEKHREFSTEQVYLKQTFEDLTNLNIQLQQLDRELVNLSVRLDASKKNILTQKEEIRRLLITKATTDDYDLKTLENLFTILDRRIKELHEREHKKIIDNFSSDTAVKDENEEQHIYSFSTTATELELIEENLKHFIKYIQDYKKHLSPLEEQLGFQVSIFQNLSLADDFIINTKAISLPEEKNILCKDNKGGKVIFKKINDDEYSFFYAIPGVKPEKENNLFKFSINELNLTDSTGLGPQTFLDAVIGLHKHKVNQCIELHWLTKDQYDELKDFQSGVKSKIEYYNSALKKLKSLGGGANLSLITIADIGDYIASPSEIQKHEIYCKIQNLQLLEKTVAPLERKLLALFKDKISQINTTALGNRFLTPNFAAIADVNSCDKFTFRPRITNSRISNTHLCIQSDRLLLEIETGCTTAEAIIDLQDLTQNAAQSKVFLDHRARDMKSIFNSVQIIKKFRQEEHKALQDAEHKLNASLKVVIKHLDLPSFDCIGDIAQDTAGNWTIVVLLYGKKFSLILNENFALGKNEENISKLKENIKEIKARFPYVNSFFSRLSEFGIELDAETSHKLFSQSLQFLTVDQSRHIEDTEFLSKFSEQIQKLKPASYSGVLSRLSGERACLYICYDSPSLGSFQPEKKFIGISFEKQGDNKFGYRIFGDYKPTEIPFIQQKIIQQLKEKIENSDFEHIKTIEDVVTTNALDKFTPQETFWQLILESLKHLNGSGTESLNKLKS